MSIPQATIARLIESGRSDLQVPEDWHQSFADLAAQDELNRLHWKDWDVAVVSLTDEELVALIMGLAHCEQQFKWIGGSVSAVIWTFRALTKRQVNSDELAEWLLGYSDNPWVPFGSNRGRAQSLNEIRIANQADSARKSANQVAERDRKEQAAVKRQSRRDEHIKLQAGHRMRWEQIVQQFEPLSPRERLQRLLLLGNDIALSSFPEPWALAIGFEVLEQVSSDEISVLQMKLESVQRGEWKSLRRRLKELDKTQCLAKANNLEHFS